MHFLSHYYVDRHKADPYRVVGAVLPDISPGFTRTYNAVIRKNDWTVKHESALIHQGVLRHYEVDMQFHGSDVFGEAVAQALEALIGSGLDRDKYRLSFIAHIAVELMLDRQLIGADPGLVNVYYDLLESVERDKLGVYLNCIMPDTQGARTLQAFDRFMEIKFLQYFDRTDGAAEGIVRTTKRAIGVDFTEEDRAKLLGALRNIEGEMRYRWHKLLEVK